MPDVLSPLGGGASAGTPSLGALAWQNQAQTGSTLISVDLTTLAATEWMFFGSSWGATRWQASNSGEEGGVPHSFDSMRLANSVYLIGGIAPTNVGHAYGSPITATDSSSISSGALSAPGTKIEFEGDNEGQGWGFDIPMYPNESGTFKMGLAQANVGNVRVRVSFLDGTVTPIDQDLAHPSPGSSAYYVYLVEVPFVNGNVGGNRLRVTFTKKTPFTPFSGRMNPVWALI